MVSQVWESVQPDLRTDDKGVATYKGSPLVIPGKGAVQSQTLKGSAIK